MSHHSAETLSNTLMYTESQSCITIPLKQPYIGYTQWKHHLPLDYSPSRSVLIPRNQHNRRNHYVMKNPPKTASPTRAEENPSRIYGLSLTLIKLSLKRRLEEAEEEILTNKQIKNMSMEGDEEDPSPRNIKGKKKKIPRNSVRWLASGRKRQGSKKKLRLRKMETKMLK